MTCEYIECDKMLGLWLRGVETIDFQSRCHMRLLLLVLVFRPSVVKLNFLSERVYHRHEVADTHCQKQQQKVKNQ